MGTTLVVGIGILFGVIAVLALLLWFERKGRRHRMDPVFATGLLGMVVVLTVLMWLGSNG